MIRSALFAASVACCATLSFATVSPNLLNVDGCGLRVNDGEPTASYTDSTFTETDGISFKYVIPPAGSPDAAIWPEVAVDVYLPASVETLEGLSKVILTYKSDNDVVFALQWDAALNPQGYTFPSSPGELTTVEAKVADFKMLDWGKDASVLADLDLTKIPGTDGLSFSINCDEVNEVKGSCQIKEVAVEGLKIEDVAILASNNIHTTAFSMKAVGNVVTLNAQAAGRYTVELFSMNGQSLRTVIGSYSAGANTVTLGARAAGMYIARVTGNGTTAAFPLMMGSVK